MHQDKASAAFHQLSQTAQLETQLSALMGLRDELIGQQAGLQRNRERLLEQRMVTDKASAEYAGLGTRVAQLDGRLASIEKQLLDVNQQVTNVRQQMIEAAKAGPAPTPEPVTVIQVPPAPPLFARGPDVGRMLFAEGLAFVLLGVVAVRFAFARGRRSAVGPGGPDAKMQQLQQSVDTIAIEVERISESQRFIAKAMGEKLPAIGEGKKAEVRS